MAVSIAWEKTDFIIELEGVTDELAWEVQQIASSLSPVGLQLRIRPKQQTNHSQSIHGKTWDAMNQQRAALIRKKVRSGLSEIEEAELAQLQETMIAHVDRIAPIPRLVPLTDSAE